MARADQNVGLRSHRSANQHRLPSSPQGSRQFWMTWTEAASCTLAVNEQLSTVAVDDVPLNLARIVGYIVQQREFDVRDDFSEGAANQMRDDLPVRQGAIRGGAHCAEIVLAQFRADRGTGKFTVRNWVEASGHHRFQIVRSHLVAKTP